MKEGLLRMDKYSRCYFLFCFAKEVAVGHSALQARVLGIDLGVNQIAVTSDKRFFGSIKARLKKRERLVSQLQAKGTRASKRKLKRISGTWRRYMAWVNHNVSKAIVSSRAGVFVMEDLSDIRKGARYNRWVHKWAFRQLQSFVEYKAIREGCRVVYVNPAYTSQECSVCHNLETVRHRGFVACYVCGHSLNSDLNASRNIAQRYMRNMCSAVVNLPYLMCDEDTASPTNCVRT